MYKWLRFDLYFSVNRMLRYRGKCGIGLAILYAQLLAVLRIIFLNLPPAGVGDGVVFAQKVNGILQLNVDI